MTAVQILTTQRFDFNPSSLGLIMTLPHKRGMVASELRRLAVDLNLSDDQKQKLNALLTEAFARVRGYKKQNPNASSDALIKMITSSRTEIRWYLTTFLNPGQIAKWDAEISKTKEFLGQRIAA